MPKCIFHLPLQIDPTRASASQIRPMKMLRAFREIGYEVAVVMGRAAERKGQGDAIKRRILAGETFDFVYSESSTMPTRLTEPNHFPVSRSIDFGFLEFCRNHGIAIGLFYRDMYWKFPEYRSIGFLKSRFGIAHYKQDLREYNRLLDVLYMPTYEAFQVIQDETAAISHVPLPPGSDVSPAVVEERIAKLDDYAKRMQFNDCARLKLLYIGGIGSHYGFDGLIEALKRTTNVEITFCVREDDFAPYPRANELNNMPCVNVVHASGADLEPLYKNADVAVMLFDADQYRRAAMPFKTFEYLAHGLPIITGDDNSVASFVNENGVGWVVDMQPDLLAEGLQDLAQKWLDIAHVSLTCMEVALSNTWKERARTVVRSLNDQRT